MCGAAAFYGGQAGAVTIRSIPNSLVVASSIVTGLIQGVVLFLPTQGAHLWPRLVVAQSSSVLGRQSQAGTLELLSPRPSLPGRHSRTSQSSLPGQELSIVSPRPELSFIISPRPSLPGLGLSVISPHSPGYSQAALSQSIVPGSHQSGGCTDNQGDVGIENCVVYVISMY
jgi:hypothetical protein